MSIRFNASELIGKYISENVLTEYTTEEDDTQYLKSTNQEINADDFYKNEEEHSDDEDELLIKKINFENTLNLIIEQLKSIIPEDYADQEPDKVIEDAGKTLTLLIELKQASIDNKSGNNIEILWELLYEGIKKLEPELKSYIDWDTIFQTIFPK
jgi:hypothetical protein